MAELTACERSCGDEPLGNAATCTAMPPAGMGVPFGRLVEPPTSVRLKFQVAAVAGGRDATTPGDAAAIEVDAVALVLPKVPSSSFDLANEVALPIRSSSWLSWTISFWAAADA